LLPNYNTLAALSNVERWRLTPPELPGSHDIRTGGNP
jgi:hypothetical protein